MIDHPGNFYLAGLVDRFHTWPTISRQTVGGHTFGVVQILLRIWPSVSRDTIIYTLNHDMGEWFAGDVQATAKWRDPELGESLDRLEEEAMRHIGLELPEISYYDRLRVKTCDYLELLMFAKHEMVMGNRHMAVPYNHIMNALHDRIFPTYDEGSDDVRLIELFMRENDLI